MKKSNCSFFLTASLLILALTCNMTSCSEEGVGPVSPDGGFYYGELSALDKSGLDDGALGAMPGDEGNPSGNTQAGIVTAGEWCDLTHWSFWSKLMQDTDSTGYADKSDYWRFYTNNRVVVRVTDEGGYPMVGSQVELLRSTGESQATLWRAVTDNHGFAECWVGLFQKETADASTLRVSVDGFLMDGHPLISSWDSTALQTTINTYALPGYLDEPVEKHADVAFIVDATGSMMDEINFLKSDLVDIINKASSVRPSLKIRTAALFYRDEGDEYVTRHSDFTEKLKSTADFVGKQKADGGGDYPEAVHTALEQMLQSLSWQAYYTRLAFLILDAPAHHEDKVIQSLQKSVQLCAQMGIRLIPVAASGVDKNTEFMLRFFAIATGGTYVFLTDDSGVGNPHIKASVGPYEVEQLNSLIIRLIEQYTE
ncbi:MAG: VWA domain-containing protein [Bacteroidaceae bacterium]|nr:VWA domain-containing protein [Bacteroidaceae bacterium]